MEAGDQAVFRGLDHTELDGLFLLDRNRRDGHLRAALDVKFDHLADVHAIDVIGAEDRDHVRLGLLDQIDVLVNGVGGAAIPVLARRTASARERE